VILPRKTRTFREIFEQTALYLARLPREVFNLCETIFTVAVKRNRNKNAVHFRAATSASDVASLFLSLSLSLSLSLVYRYIKLSRGRISTWMLSLVQEERQERSFSVNRINRIGQIRFVSALTHVNANHCHVE